MGALKTRLKNRFGAALIRHSRFFDERWYREHHTCPPAPGEDAALHYLQGGWRNGNPSRAFDQQKYFKANPDVEQSGNCPLLHYLTYGKIERRKKSPDEMEVPYRRFRAIRFLQRKWFERKYRGIIHKNREARILVIVHVYYEDAIGEILEYLKNLETYSYDLIVTTVRSRDLERIEEEFRAFRPEMKLQVYENRGFDVAPFLWALKSVDLDDYEMVFKLQSKRSFSRKGSVAASSFYVRGRDWFLYLFESVLGSAWVHRNIDRLRNDDGTELICAKNLYMRDKPHNEHLTTAQLKKHGIEIRPGYYFTAGTCFAAKAAALARLKQLKLEPGDFDASERGSFSLAHALERYLTAGIPPKACHTNDVCTFRQKIRKIQGRRALKYNGIRISLDPSFELDDEFVFRFLAPATVYEYETTEVTIGSLRVVQSGKRVPLERSEAYRCSCAEKKREPDCLSEAKEHGERADGTASDLDGEIYALRHPIVVLDHNEIVDGLGRACRLLEQEGPLARCSVLRLFTEEPGRGGAERKR